MSAPSPSRRGGAAPKVVRDLAALAFGQLAGKALGFAAFAWLARVLEPAGYGAVEYAAGVAMIGGMVLDAGLSPIGVRRIARQPESAPRVAAEVLGARLVLALGLALALAAIAPLAAPEPLARRVFWIYAASLLAVPWAQAWLFQAIDRIGFSALVQGVRMAAFALAVVVLVRSAGQVLWVGVAEILGLAVSGLCAALLTRRLVGRVRIRFVWPEARALLREGLPVGAANLIWSITHYSPLLLSVNLLGAAAAAHFAAAHRLYLALATLSWIYHFNLFPAIARLTARDSGELAPLVRASFRCVAWGSVLLATVLTLLARPLLSLMFGAPFGEAAPAFAILVWALPATLLGDHAAWTLVAHGGERAVSLIQLGGLLVALLAGIPAVLALGPLGGAAAMAGSTVLTWSALHFAARQRLGWMPWTPALAPALGAAALLLGARLAALGPFAAAALAAVAFAALALLVDRALPADWRRLARAKQSPGP